ncbi:hypothetical protein [Vibrio sonorensis]|uniref:hypothetical protein n=1 Tax=Vibrio sonorensis TaxID=1004316 RepID=UPI0008D9455B|nr:hypothetical protein [Vibrio sonorensis]
MNTFHKTSFVLFSIIALLMIATGATYLTAPTIMPYHLAAMETTWQGLSQGMQNMSVNFMKSVSAGFLSSGLAVLILLAVPFRKGETWSVFAIFALVLTQVGIIATRTYDVSVNTMANPPLFPLLAVLVLAVIGFVLALFKKPTLR